MADTSLLLAQIAGQPWMITPQQAVALGPLYKALLEDGLQPEYKPATFSLFTENGFEHGLSSAKDAPDKSIGIINLSGVMLRDGDWCTYGTEELAAYVDELAANDSVVGIIIKTKSGGGAADSIAPLRQAVEAAKQVKPVLFVGSLMGSAAYYTACSGTEIWATEETAMIGSVGVMISVQDAQPMWEAAGVKFHTVYADQSTEKNRPFEAMLEGDYKPMREEMLNPLAQDFIDYVRANRPNAVSDPKALQGKMYLAMDALNVGLIDRIGTIKEAIAYIYELAEESQSTPNQEFSTHQNSLNMKQYPYLLTLLGMAELVLTDGSAHLTAEQVSGLQEASKARFGEPLTIANASVDADGGYDLKAEGLAALEEQLIQLADKTLDSLKAESGKSTALAEKLQSLEKEMEALKNEPEEIEKPMGNTRTKPVFDITGKDYTASSRPWNRNAALRLEGKHSEANALLAQMTTKENMKLLMSDYESFLAASTLDLEKVNTELGLHQQVDQNINQWERDAQAALRINNLFPAFSTGIENEYSQITMYTQEFLQPRNTSWSEKGGFKFDAETITVNEYQVSHRFTAAQIWQFARTWLTNMTTGDNPYQEPLVAYLNRAMLTHINNVERPKAIVKGVHQTPADGVAGASINAMSGILRAVQERIAEHRVLTTPVGTGSYDHYDSNGELNMNHFFFKVDAVYKSIPQEIRDAFNWTVYVSKEDAEAYKRFMVKALATDSNFAKQEAAYQYDNMMLESVPFWPKGLIVITMPGNFVRVYRERADDNRLTVERFQRDTYVFMDAAGKVSPIYSGQRYSSLAELQAANYETQAIFTNGEFGAYTPIVVAADDATPSVEEHTVLVTSANTGATAITNFDGAVAGQIIYLVGGSDTNASTIADDAANFLGIPSGGLSFTTGVKAKFLVASNGKFILLATWTAASEGTIEFAADDATPSLLGGYSFLTSADGTDGNTAITDFDDAEVGVTYTFNGGGGSFPSTIANSGKFANLASAITFAEGTVAKLIKRPDGLWVEVV